MIPFGEYLPDQADFENPGLTIARNVIPKTATSYGPFPSQAVYSDALDARCQGAFSGLSSAGNVTTFAVDATKAYKIADGLWASVNTGLTTGAEETVRFAQYGNRVMWTNVTDNVQNWILESSTSFSDLSAAAPKARHIAIIAPGFTMLGNTVDSVDGAVPDRVWWSGIAEPNLWPVPGTANAQAAQSDYNDMPTGNAVQGLIGSVGGASGAVFMLTSIYRIQYQGPPDIFGFYEVERARGTPAPNSIVNIGSRAFYLGEEDFYTFNGMVSEPIGAGKIAKRFWSTVDQSYLHRISAVADPINKLVLWAYPATGNSNGTPNRIICFNWELGRWSEIDDECEMLWRFKTPGYTLDSLDNYLANVDQLPYSLDSRIWTGGKDVLAAFNTSHKTTAFSGSALEATFETAEFSGQDRRVFVTGVRPVVNGGTPTCAIGYRDTPQGAVNYTTGTAAGSNGICPQRIATRYARAKFVIPAGDSWSHASGFEPVLIQEGRR